MYRNPMTEPLMVYCEECKRKHKFWLDDAPYGEGYVGECGIEVTHSVFQEWYAKTEKNKVD